jgi:branched-chain amino acid transport system permease protein
LLTLQVVNSLSFSLLLFLIAAGLSITFGLMNVANMAHGSFYMLGGYLAFTLLSAGINFWAVLFIVPLLVALVGGVLEIGLLQPVYRRDHLDQVLLTIGIAYVFSDMTDWIWGQSLHLFSPPKSLSGSIDILGQPYPFYRIAVLIGGAVIACILLWVEARTKLGAVLRAGVSDPDMLSAVGINVSLAFTLAFALGVALAALAGVVAGPIFGLYRGVDFDVLMLAIIVVVVGGLGPLRGTLLSSIIIGTIDNFTKVYLPDLSLVSMFLIMAAVLIFKPTGLSGFKR